MFVEDVVTDFNHFNATHNCYGSKVIRSSISKRAAARIIRYAREHFDGFGIDFAQYGEPEISLVNTAVAQVEWKHRASGKTLSLCEIWFEKRTGEVWQAGQHYGNIVS